MTASTRRSRTSPRKDAAMENLAMGGAGGILPVSRDPQAGLVADIAKSVARRECILFLGAGVHSPPPTESRFTYPEAERPPRGGDLSEYLAGLCQFREKLPNESPRNLQRVSLCHELQEGKGRKNLVAEVELMVNTGKRPSPVVRALAALDFPLVITTNYDQLFERA